MSKPSHKHSAKYVQLDNRFETVVAEKKQVGLDILFFKRARQLLHHSFSMTGFTILFLILFLALSQAYVTSYTGKIIGKFYTSITTSDFDLFMTILWEAVLIILLSSFIQSTLMFKTSWLSLVLRTRLVTNVHNMYFKGNTYYNMCFLSEEIDNPDQRITRDVEVWTTQFCIVLNGIISSPIIIIMYTYLTIQKIGWYAPPVVYGYFIIGYGINKLVMSPIASLIWKQEKLEGNLRFFHTRIRTYGESIAMYDGHSQEKHVANKLFEYILLNRYDVIVWEWLLNSIVNTWSYAGSILNYCVVAVPIFAFDKREGTADYVAEASFLLIMLISGFSQITNISTSLSELAGITSRVAELFEFFITVDHDKVDILINNTGSIEFKDFSCYSPNGELLLEDLNFVINNESLLITGPSGAGKTTLLRCMCGIWPYYEGSISLPENIFFTPQEPYLTIGNIYEQITYPDNLKYDNEEEIYRLLLQLKIDHLVELEGEVFTWTKGLSRGERQRIGLCRLLFHNPKFAILDESTSCIDKEMEETFFTLCDQRDIIVVSVGHHLSLEAHHTNTAQIIDKKLHFST